MSDENLIDQPFLDANPAFVVQGLAIGDPLPTQEVIDQVNAVAAEKEKNEQEKIRRYRLLQPDINERVEIEAGSVLRMTAEFAEANFSPEAIQEITEGDVQGVNPAPEVKTEKIQVEIPLDPEHPFKVIKDGSFVRAFDSLEDATTHAGNIGGKVEQHPSEV